MNTKQVKFKDWLCTVYIAEYPVSDGRTAIQLNDAEDGMPIATATVNLPDLSLEPDHVFIKGWSENEGMADALIEAGIIGPEVRKVPTGFVSATVHKLLI